MTTNRLPLRRSNRTAKRAVFALVAAALMVFGGSQAYAKVWAPIPLELMVSPKADRSGAVSLDGTTIAGRVSIFASNVRSTESVAFYVDDPKYTKSPVGQTSTAPYDMVGRDGVDAKLFDTAKLSPGSHTVTVVHIAKSGSIERGEAKFTVMKDTRALVP